MIDLLPGDLDAEDLLLELRSVQLHLKSQYSLLGNAHLLEKLHQRIEEVLGGFEAEGHVCVIQQVILIDFDAKELHLGLVAKLNDQNGLVV